MIEPACILSLMGGCLGTDARIRVSAKRITIAQGDVPGCVAGR
jgi:hypothetical protein